MPPVMNGADDRVGLLPVCALAGPLPSSILLWHADELREPPMTPCCLRSTRAGSRAAVYRTGIDGGVVALVDFTNRRRSAPLRRLGCARGRPAAPPPAAPVCAARRRRARAGVPAHPWAAPTAGARGAAARSPVGAGQSRCGPASDHRLVKGAARVSPLRRGKDGEVKFRHRTRMCVAADAARCHRIRLRERPRVLEPAARQRLRRSPARQTGPLARRAIEPRKGTLLGDLGVALRPRVAWPAQGTRLPAAGPPLRDRLVTQS